LLLRLYDDDSELIDRNRMKAQAEEDASTNGRTEAASDAPEGEALPVGNTEADVDETPLEL
jgi:hypothetical protein